MRIPVVAVSLLACVFPRVLGAQDATSRKRPCGEVKASLAVQEALAANLAINRFDAWVLGEEWAKADFESWSRNLRLGWEWDENAFQTNMFGHPFHGAMYFNSGRANCLSYWESVPLAFLGSFTWEFFGETYRPSLNDFFMTSFGGIALGEMTHRVAATIRDTEQRGGWRILRELTATVLNPMDGLNRLFRGQWTRAEENPADHDPGAFFLRLNEGVRRVHEDSAGISNIAPTILADLGYGDPFVREFSEPFDVFQVRAQVTPWGGGLNLLQASGRLYQARIGGWGERTRHAFVVNQRYDFIKNPAYSFGQQSFEAGIISRFGFPRRFAIRTKLAGDAAVLGAIDAPYGGVGERTYDFGPGVGATLDVRLERNGITYVAFYNRGEFLHSVSGASANHWMFFSGLELTVPLKYGVGIGAYISGDARDSRYAGPQGSHVRQFLESRFFVSYTTSRIPAEVRR